MAKASELLKQAVARREEASSRRGLARLTPAGESRRQLRRQAEELEAQAEKLKKEADSLPPEGARKHRRAGAGTPKR